MASKKEVVKEFEKEYGNHNIVKMLKDAKKTIEAVVKY